MTNLNFTAEFMEAMITGHGRKAADLRKAKLRALAIDAMSGWDNDIIVTSAKTNDRVVNREIRLGGSSIKDVVNSMTQTTLASIILGQQDESSTVAALVSNTNPKHFGLDLPEGSVVTDTFITMLKALTQPDSSAFGKALADCVEVGISLDSSSIDITGTHADLHETLSAIEDDDEEGEDSGKASTEALPEVNVNADPGSRKIVNSVLSSLGLSPIEEIESALRVMKDRIEASEHGPKGINVTFKFEGKPALQAVNGYPDGQMKQAKAAKLFDIEGKGAAPFEFDVPTFEWDGPHPLVPEIDEDYQFEPKSLMRVLWALVANKKAWLHGHTGTGKSTLIEQVCARTKYPLVRINFDSEITRMDLIGRDKLTSDNGNSVTKFEDGILPHALGMPCVILCDEMDFIRPDVAYVMQRALEDKGLLLTEDGGRLVHPDPMCRIVATGNTKGNGDNSGRYMGARPQSGAFLDRFTCWIEVDYMNTKALAKLLKAKVPNLTSDDVSVFVKYAKEHWVGFRNGDIQLPLSPRGLIAAAEAYSFFSGVMDQKAAMQEAMGSAISDRSDESDQQTIDGLVQRVAA